MKRPADLTREQLEEIAAYAQSDLFLDINYDDHDEIPSNAEYWNPDKDVSGSDFIDHMMFILSKHGLVPKKPTVMDS